MRSNLRVTKTSTSDTWRTQVRVVSTYTQFPLIIVYVETTSANVDSARGNLSRTFINAFVNASLGNDKFMAGADEGNSWIYKNKDRGEFDSALALET